MLHWDTVDLQLTPPLLSDLRKLRSSCREPVFTSRHSISWRRKSAAKQAAPVLHPNLPGCRKCSIKHVKKACGLWIFLQTLYAKRLPERFLQGHAVQTLIAVLWLLTSDICTGKPPKGIQNVLWRSEGPACVSFVCVCRCVCVQVFC